MNKTTKATLFSLFFIFTINAQNLGRLKTVNAFNPLLKIKGIYFEVNDSGQNTEMSEIGTDVFRKKYIILSNKARGFTSSTKIKETKLPINNIFCADILENYNLGMPLIFSRVLNSKQDQAGVTFTPNEKNIYFTRSKKSNLNSYSLYKGVLDEESKYYWTGITELKINADDFSIETPYIGEDPKKIYVSSNKPGGFGGYDLYEGLIDANGEISNLTNLGPTINTEKDEKHPFLDANGKYFYFSSTGHIGFGGYDVFRSSIVDNKYVNVNNLGNTLNTPTDDIAFILVDEYNNGYITTNEEKDSTDYSVYKFRMIDLEQDFLIQVTDFDDNTPLADSDIIIKNEFSEILKRTRTDSKGIALIKGSLLTKYFIFTEKNQYNGAETTFTPVGTENYEVGVHNVALVKKKYSFAAEIVDIDSKEFLSFADVVVLDKNKTAIYKTQTNEKGNFYLKDMPENSYIFQISKQGYHNQEIVLSDSKNATTKSINKRFEAIKDETKIIGNQIVVESKPGEESSGIENIYFDFDKATIKQISFATLNKISNLLKAKSKIKISINAHTDSKGTDEYNMKLSQGRALSVYQYFIKKGIAKSRLKHHAFGETKHKVACGDACTPEEDALNRRVEFIIQ